MTRNTAISSMYKYVTNNIIKQTHNNSKTNAELLESILTCKHFSEKDNRNKSLIVQRC